LTNVIHDGGWFVHASAGAYNVVYCNVTALDVIYTYTADRFITRSSSPVPAQDARYIISGGYLEGMEIIKTLVEGVGTKAGESYEAAFGLELTRRFLGLGAIIYQPTEATDVSQELTAIGSKFDLIPFALLLLGMTAYGQVADLVCPLSLTHLIVMQCGGFVHHVASHLMGSGRSLRAARFIVPHKSANDRSRVVWARRACIDLGA
jgi:hypothetical protein